MLHIYTSGADGNIKAADAFESGCWVNLAKPTEDELTSVAENLGIDLQDLQAPIDPEEGSRVSIEDGYVLILVDIPSTEIRNSNESYTTIPFAIFLCDKGIVTVCAEKVPLLSSFTEGRAKGCSPLTKTRFAIQLLYRISHDYLVCLSKIDRLSDEIEQQLYSSTRNKELIKLLELKKALVYFNTSLKQNERVLEKLAAMKEVEKGAEEEELLKDTIIENRQALEMAGIYANITGGVMDAYASVVANNQNSIMKTLALIAIIMSIPTMIFSAYGMNLAAEGMPFTEYWWGFAVIVIGAFVVSLLAALFFVLRKWF